ncbi:hypothetical protein Bca52824_003302 [Brassica carinata]|uniref:Uncharacterized protein n=1 Tax=Brassica carinata TaxID=52824 RepID=A0A8X8BEL3_BRACI|nr:hypothetical protein Bca52824_003302 [Brassica carinata]
MANLSSAIDSVFWDQNLSSPQTLEGTARSVPGEPFPVDGARASRSHRIQQLSLFSAKAFLSESSLLLLLLPTRDSALSLSTPSA